MVRTIIQLTEKQAKELRQRSKKEGVSMSELVRQGIDIILSKPSIDDETWRRAMEAVGFAKGGPPDLSERHDEYLAQAIEEQHGVR